MSQQLSRFDVFFFPEAWSYYCLQVRVTTGDGALYNERRGTAERVTDVAAFDRI